MSTGEELGREIAELAARLDAATHRLLECIRQFDESQAWGGQGALSCAHWLSWRIGLDPATAREKVRVAKALGGLPAIDGALAAGRLSYSKVRAMTRVATPANEQRLLELGLSATGAQLERICRGYRAAATVDEPIEREDRYVTRRCLPGGMVKVEMVLSPDEADLVIRAIDRAREDQREKRKAKAAGASAESPKATAKEGAQASQEDGAGGAGGAQGSSPAKPGAGARVPWPTHADGVVAMAEAYLAAAPGTASSHGGDRYQVVVHLDQDVLAPDGTMAATLEDGTVVSAETLRRVACDCGLVASTGDGNGLDLGRRTRSISAGLRRALNLRAHGCQFPGCTHDRFLHAHHIRHWLHGGPTNLDNLLHLCPRHHRLVHEDGWHIERQDDGDWQFKSPDGKAQLAPVATAWTGPSLKTWTDERHIEIKEETNENRWDGSPPDYDVAVAGLFG